MYTSRVIIRTKKIKKHRYTTRRRNVIKKKQIIYDEEKPSTIIIIRRRAEFLFFYENNKKLPNVRLHGVKHFRRSPSHYAVYRIYYTPMINAYFIFN